MENEEKYLMVLLMVCLVAIVIGIILLGWWFWTTMFLLGMYLSASGRFPGNPFPAEPDVQKTVLSSSFGSILIAIVVGVILIPFLSFYTTFTNVCIGIYLECLGYAGVTWWGRYNLSDANEEE